MTVSYRIGIDTVTVSASAETELLDALRALDDRFASNAIDFLEAAADQEHDLAGMLESVELEAIAAAAAATPATVRDELGQLVASIEAAMGSAG